MVTHAAPRDVPRLVALECPEAIFPVECETLSPGEYRRFVDEHYPETAEYRRFGEALGVEREA